MLASGRYVLLSLKRSRYARTFGHASRPAPLIPEVRRDRRTIPFERKDRAFGNPLFILRRSYGTMGSRSERRKGEEPSGRRRHIDLSFYFALLFPSLPLAVHVQHLWPPSKRRRLAGFYFATARYRPLTHTGKLIYFLNPRTFCSYRVSHSSVSARADGKTAQRATGDLERRRKVNFD